MSQTTDETMNGAELFTENAAAPTRFLEERTVPGLHVALASVFIERVPLSAKIIDLGAGSGAWLKCLASMGYRDLTAADRDTTILSQSGLECRELDLNDDFPVGLRGLFDAVCAIEVIEHLENPHLFLRRCKALIRPGGCIVITTPNLESIPGRLRFLFTGHFRFFDRDPRYNDPTHITPIQSFLFLRAVQSNGLEVAYHGFNSPRTTGTRWMYRALSLLLRPALSGVLGGDVHIYVLKSSN